MTEAELFGGIDEKAYLSSGISAEIAAGWAVIE
jgi:hypothetical protein